MPRIEVVLVAKGRAAAYMRKAEQFCRAAAQEADAERFDAALLCAVHAGITGADAYCVAIGGRRSKDPDHLRAADLLDEVGKSSPPVREKAAQLRALVRQKNRVEYEDKPVGRADATTAVRRCERLVDWVRSELATAGIARTV